MIRLDFRDESVVETHRKELYKLLENGRSSIDSSPH